MRAILRRRRGANGRFCRGIPRFLNGARARRGDSAHGGQCRASSAKNFFKKGRKRAKNRKIGVLEVPEGDPMTPSIGCAGRFLGLEARPLAVLLEMRFVRAPQLRAPEIRSQSFAPLIYGEPVCKLHHSPYGGASACPNRNSLTFTCGLRLPTCRILVTTISSQSR